MDFLMFLDILERCPPKVVRALEPQGFQKKILLAVNKKDTDFVIFQNRYLLKKMAF